MWSHHSGPFKGCISLTLTAWFFSWDCEDLVLIMHGTSDKTPPQTSSHPGIMISKERWSSMRGWLWNKQLSTCSTTLVANVIVPISICNAHFHWQLSKWQMPLALNQYGSWTTNNSVCGWQQHKWKFPWQQSKKTNGLCQYKRLPNKYTKQPLFIWIVNKTIEKWERETDVSSFRRQKEKGVTHPPSPQKKRSSIDLFFLW